MSLGRFAAEQALDTSWVNATRGLVLTEPGIARVVKQLLHLQQLLTALPRKQDQGDLLSALERLVTANAEASDTSACAR